MSAKDFARLTDVEWRRNHESENGLFVAEGAKVIGRAFSLGYKPREVLTSDRWIESLPQDLLNHTEVHLVSESEMEVITGFHVHRGALASFERPKAKNVVDVVEDAQSIAILEGLVDHENVGAIFRSAAGLGIDAILITEDCADPLYRRSIKTSMGATLTLPYARISQIGNVLPLLKEFDVAGLVVNADESLSHLTFDSRKQAVVFGSEGHGLSAQTLGLINRQISIPMKNSVDSLNVAQCASIVFWALSQRVKS